MVRGSFSVKAWNEKLACCLIIMQWNETKIISQLAQVRKYRPYRGGISFIDQT